MALVPTDRDLTFMAFMQRVSTPASCLKHLEAIRWREGESCLKCDFVGQRYRLRDGKSHKCPACKKLFMMITDTMFGGSPVKLLPKWFVAIWIETNHRKGSSTDKAHRYPAKDIPFPYGGAVSPLSSYVLPQGVGRGLTTDH